MRIDIPNASAEIDMPNGTIFYFNFTQPVTFLTVEHGGHYLGVRPSGPMAKGLSGPYYAVRQGDVAYCWTGGGPACPPCTYPPHKPPTAAGHVIHIGGGFSSLIKAEGRALDEAFESAAKEERFREYWPKTREMLELLASRIDHPLPEKVAEVLAAVYITGEEAYKHGPEDE